MRIRDLDHLVLNVADVERSLAFYCGVLDMEPVRVEDWRAGKVPFPSVRASPAAIIDLVALPRGEANPDPSGETNMGPSGEMNMDHFCLVVDPVDWQAIIDSGDFTVLEGPVSRFGARGQAQSIYVRDPDGNRVELRWYPEDSQ